MLTPQTPWIPPPPPGRSLRRELQSAQGFSAWALLLAMVGSVVGTIFTTAFGTGHWGTLAGAAVGPVVSTTFSTRITGETGGVRNAIIIILSIGALLITVSGFTLADYVAGKSVLPSPDPQAGIFVPVSRSEPSPPPATPKGPFIKTQPSDSLDCGTAAVGEATACSQAVRITSNGTEALHITGIEISGSSRQDFIVSRDCVGRYLRFGEICELQVSFQPTAAGSRQAALIIHQNIPLPDHGTQVTLTGTGVGPGPSPTTSPTTSPATSPGPATGPPTSSASTSTSTSG